ncbi:inositol-tetrakisphosphate 1-kinase [Halyomorpha halys]|uniref:inositol-tetrakisphosphate 1-kinase n=1 Tax=Halyomorpha halys TaxID=286706 RepID=UPI0006D4FA9C|nr:inositol-tetrakisphosphate 1-kinase-like [Halyomorpha halys]
MESSKNKQRKIIGYWMSEKKSQKLNWSEFAKVSRSHGFDLVKVDLNRPLEEQGPFTVIIHKLTDIIAQSLRGEKRACEIIEHVENYIKLHPEVLIIDPLENVKKLLDRFTSYRVVHDSDLHNIDVFTPPFVELTSNDIHVNLQTLKEAGVKFPFVCKPSVANGTDCHNMAIVFNEKGLKDCQPPCVAHAFVNHNAVLYKLFIIGGEYHIVERPSLKNFYPDPDRETIYFNSHDVSKSDSSSSLSVLDEDEPSDECHTKADPATLGHIVEIITAVLGMNLLGVDIVVENKTGRHAIIDINPYPGYDGYPNFFESLIRCIRSKVFLNQGLTRIFPSEEDSGFETADSSDEKKRSPLLPVSKAHERQL